MNNNSITSHETQLRQELEELKSLLASKEQQIEQLKALESQETLLQLVLDNIPQLIFWKDRNSVFQGCNRLWAKAAGFKHPNEVIGKTDADLYPGQNLEQYLEEDRQVVNSGQSIHHVEYKSHKDVWYDTRKIPIRDTQGNIVGILATIEDITQRKQAEQVLTDYHRTLEAQIAQRTEALEKAKKVADAANQAKSTFISHMSHELRTPLNAIIGFAQILGQDTTLKTEQKQKLDIINRSGEHLLSLINSILEISKIEAGQTTLTENHFDLYHLLNEIQALFSLKCQTKGLQLIFQIASDVPQYISTDEGKLRQILLNLLGNAIKFTERGCIILKVSRETEQENAQFLYFEVKDTGLGICEQDLEKLFLPFEQTETGQKSKQGTGLGLFISRQYVQLMGGKISAQSRVGIGTCFTFNIPCHTCLDQTIVPKLTQKVVSLVPNQPHYRILVVDDCLENRLLLVQLLSSVGFEVLEAGNGREAIAVWETYQPHLIWMDMLMSEMDGYEATRWIKAHSQEQKTVIIALTASAFEEEKTLCLSAGCDDFVRKPFQESVIWEKMAQYLGIKYIYAEKTPLQETLSVSVALNSEALDVMPQAWIEQLYQMASQLNRKQVLKLIEGIPQSHALLAKQLKQLAQNYEFNKIAELAKRDV